MKRFLPLIGCVLGLVALLLLLPVFDPPQPRNVRITRDQAQKLADAEARKLGVKIDDTWSVVTWENHILLESEFKGKPELRRRASSDPIVGPRMVAYQVVYFYTASRSSRGPPTSSSTRLPARPSERAASSRPKTRPRP